MVEEVKLRRKYLNSGDVFILDLGLDLVQVGYSNVWMSIMRQSEGAGPCHCRDNNRSGKKLLHCSSIINAGYF